MTAPRLDHPAGFHRRFRIVPAPRSATTAVADLVDGFGHAEVRRDGKAAATWRLIGGGLAASEELAGKTLAERIDGLPAGQGLAGGPDR